MKIIGVRGHSTFGTHPIRPSLGVGGAECQCLLKLIDGAQRIAFLSAPGIIYGGPDRPPQGFSFSDTPPLRQISKARMDSYMILVLHTSVVSQTVMIILRGISYSGSNMQALEAHGLTDEACRVLVPLYQEGGDVEAQEQNQRHVGEDR